MRNIGIIAVVTFLGVLVSAVYFFGSPTFFADQGRKVEAAQPTPTPYANGNERLVLFGEWMGRSQGDDRTLTYTVTTSGDFPSTAHLVIRDDMQNVLYKEEFGSVSKVFWSYMLRKDLPQLVIEYYGGGQDNFVRILDLQKGKVVDLTKDEGWDMSFRSGAEVVPRFATGVVTWKEPYQLLLTNPGLPGAGEKMVSVFRFRDGQYRYFGKYSRERADTMIEGIMQKRAPEK